MNCIKAKLISVKNRLVRIIQRRKPSTASRRSETPRRRVASLLRTRSRMRLQRRQREQRAASRDQEQCENGSASSVEDDATNASVVVEVENPTTLPLTTTLSLNSLTSTSSITSTTFSHSSFDEDDYVDDSGLSSVYFDSERDEDKDGGIITENSFTESGWDADISSLNDTLSLSEDDEVDEPDLEDLTGLEVSAAVVEHRMTSFSGAVALLDESSSEEDPTGDRDQERALGVEDGELHQTNLSGDNVFQWWEDQLHSAVQQRTSRDEDAESETSSMAELRSICGDDDREPTPLPSLPSLPDTIDPSYFDINQRQCDPRDQHLNHHQQHNLISETEVGCYSHNTNQLHAAPEEDLTRLEFTVRHLQQCAPRDEDAESETSSMAELRSICRDDDREPTPLPTLPSLPDTIDPSYFDSNLGQCDPRNQDLNHHHHLQQQLNATNLTTEVGVGAGYDGHSTSQYQSNAQQYHHVPGSAFSGIGCDPQVGQFLELGRQSTSHSHHLTNNYCHPNHHFSHLSTETQHQQGSQQLHGSLQQTGLSDQQYNSVYNSGQQEQCPRGSHFPQQPYLHLSSGHMPQQAPQQAPQQHQDLVQSTGLPDQLYNSIWNFGQYKQSLREAAVTQAVPATITPDIVRSTALPHSGAASQQTHGLVQPTGVPDPWYYSLWNGGHQEHTQRAAMRQLSPAAVIVPNSPQVPVQSAALPLSTGGLQDFPQDVSKLVTEQQTPLSSRKKKPASLSLSLGETDALISPHSPPSSPPPPPSVPAPSTAERKWEEYIANRPSLAEYFLYPPFTAEQEEWIVRVNHPFKDYVLKTWQEQVHSSIEESLGLHVT